MYNLAFFKIGIKTLWKTYTKIQWLKFMNKKINIFFSKWKNITDHLNWTSDDTKKLFTYFIVCAHSKKTRLEYCLLIIYLSLCFHTVINNIFFPVSFMGGKKPCVVILFHLPFILAFGEKKSLEMDKWGAFRLRSRNFSVLVWSLVCGRCL